MLEKEWMLPFLDLRNSLDFRNNSAGQEEANDHHLRDFRRMTGAVQMMSAGKTVPGPYTEAAREQWLKQLLRLKHIFVTMVRLRWRILT